MAKAPEPGTTLKAEAIALIGRQEWRQAERVARTAKTLRPTDIEVDGLLAIALANRPFARGVRSSLTTLNERLANDRDLSKFERAAGLTAMSAALLARGDHRGADAAARQATTLAPDQPAPWWQLAASYAGLGWFDDAETCLETAASKANGNEAPPMVALQVGRAVNRWAMTKSQAAWIGIIGWLFMGMLGLAFAITTPFVAREFRVSRLEGDLKAMADEAWQSQHGLRIVAATAVAVVVAIWLGAILILGGG